MLVILLAVLLTNLMHAVQQRVWVSTGQVCIASGADLVCAACSAGSVAQRCGGTTAAAAAMGEKVDAAIGQGTAGPAIPDAAVTISIAGVLPAKLSGDPACIGRRGMK